MFRTYHDPKPQTYLPLPILNENWNRTDLGNDLRDSERYEWMRSEDIYVNDEGFVANIFGRDNRYDVKIYDPKGRSVRVIPDNPENSHDRNIMQLHNVDRKTAYEYANWALTTATYEEATRGNRFPLYWLVK